MNKLTKISLALAMLCGTASAMAQTAYYPSWYVMPTVDVIRADDRYDTDTGGGLGLRFGRAVSPDFDVQVGGNYSRTNGNNRRMTTGTLGVDALYMFSRDQFRPFLLIGAGAERDVARRQRDTSPYINAGLGFQYTLSDQWSMQADLRRVHAFQKREDFPFRGTNNDVLSFGLIYQFDKPVVAQKAQYTPPAPAPYVAPKPMPAPAPAPAPAARFEQIKLSATELFEFDRAVLRLPQPKLDEIASALSGANGTPNVMITGYTDRLGSDAYNQRLSEARANAVKAYLVGKGVPASRLSAQGKGEANPVVTCNNKKRADLIKCLEPNRRVEVEQITIERRVN